MGKQAKIQISADVSQLKTQIESAKKDIKSLGSVKVSGSATKELKAMLGKDLQNTIDETTKKIDGLNTRIEAMATAGSKSPQAIKQIKEMSSEVDGLNDALKETIKLKANLDTGVAGGAGAVAKKSGGMMNAVSGGVGKVAGMVGLGLGLSELYSTGVNAAKQRTGIKSLTGGAAVGADSSMGYAPEERRERAREIAGGISGNISEKNLTGLTNFSERLERSFGVDAGTTAGAIQEGRKSGVKPEDQQKYLARSIGVAVANGLEGGRVGEYLSSMTEYMASVSDGITINMDSINAFAGAFGDIPFFKNDPSRLFSSLKGMDSAFKGGDRFQQGLFARSMQMSQGGEGSTPAGLELRKKLGLAGGNKDLAKRTGISELGISGSDIMKNTFEQIKASTQGQDKREQMFQFMEQTGLQGQGGMEIFDKISKGGQISDKDIAKAQMSPEKQLENAMQERLNNTFSGVDRSVMTLDANIKALKELLAGDLMKVLNMLVEGLKKITDLLPGGGSLEMAKTGIEVGALALGGKYLAGTTAGKAVTGAASGAAGAIAGGINAVGTGAGLTTAGGLAATAGAGLLVGGAGYGGYKAGQAFNDTSMGKGLSDWLTSGAGISDEDAFNQAGIKQREKDAMRPGPIGSGVLAPGVSSSEIGFPQEIKTSDPAALEVLLGIYNAVSKGGGGLLMRQGPAPIFGGGKVGK